MSHRQPEHCQLPTPRPTPQVFCLRGVCVCVCVRGVCVCVFYTLLFVLLLPELGEAARPRCGVELVADLEFVCGDRGFYRGRARAGGSRPRGGGIVEHCCMKGCDLQYLEQYCAKPSRGRRQAPASPMQPRQYKVEGDTIQSEVQFLVLVLRQYQRFLQLDTEKLAQRAQE